VEQRRRDKLWSIVALIMVMLACVDYGLRAIPKETLNRIDASSCAGPICLVLAACIVGPSVTYLAMKARRRQDADQAGNSAD